MPIFPIPNKKVAILNEQKNRALLVEFPSDMGLGELLDRVDEFRNDILKKIEEKKDTMTEKQFQKACSEGEVVENIGD